MIITTSNFYLIKFLLRARMNFTRFYVQWRSFYWYAESNGIDSATVNPLEQWYSNYFAHFRYFLLIFVHNRSWVHSLYA